MWGLALGVLFFASYNSVNGFTAQRGEVGSYVFGWERHIPFLAWTILPYWSIDLLYGIALFASPSRAALFTLGKRLLAAQAICIAGFLLWPLRFSFGKPASDGLFGALFDALANFDLPYNQAPSLHICLLVVLWRHYATLLVARRWRALLHGWFALIALSVLTTWQHHSIDLITGFWAGACCLLLVPDADLTQRPQWRWHGQDAPRRRLALRYLAGSLLAGVLGYVLFPAASAWLAYWLAGALAWVGAIYLCGDAGHFAKRDGRLPWRSWMVLGPYLLAARLNVWWWTRRLPVGTAVLDEVFVGRQPDPCACDAHGIRSVIDLCAEVPMQVRTVAYHPQLLLDLLPPPTETLRQAATRIEAAQRQGAVWVCCALGFSRSAAAVAAWLICHRGHSVEAALARIRAARPAVVLSPATLQNLARLSPRIESLSA